jgi:transposase-like protein
MMKGNAQSEFANNYTIQQNARAAPTNCVGHQRHFTGFDDKIVPIYARGMRVREIQGHVKEIYEVEVNPDLISQVTDAVIEEARDW